MQYRIEKIGIQVLAFMVARCQLLGLYPFVVPFFMAAYVKEISSMRMFVVLMLGIISTLNGVATLRYALVLGMLMVMMRGTDRKRIFATRIQIAMASGAILWAVSMPFQYIVTRQDVMVLYTLLEGIIAGCGVIIYAEGFDALRAGAGRVFASNERFVGLIALLVTALFGCPLKMGNLPLLMAVCGYVLLSFCYRFEGSVGISIGGATGVVMAIRTGEISWLAVLLALSAIMVLLRELGKIGLLVAFAGGYILLGLFYENTLLEPSNLIGVMAILGSFLLTPHSLLRRVPPSGSTTPYGQDFLMQEVTKSRVEDFGQAFLTMEHMLMVHEKDREPEIPSGLSNIYLSGDGISLLNAVESQSNRLYEMRRNFVRQLGQIGEIITAFPREMEQQSLSLERFESDVRQRLLHLGIILEKAVLVQNNNQRVEAYISCRNGQTSPVTGDNLAKEIGKVLGRKMVCLKRGDEFVGKEESCFLFVEAGQFFLTTGIVRKNRQGEALCGDNFSISKVDSQKAVLMLSDGMGSGQDAYLKSEQIVELLEQLLAAGFRRELAIELLNSFISFLSDGSVSSTLDLTMLDLYTGMADFVKLGASTTFIRRKDRVECIRSTSLPVGVLEQVEFDTCGRRLYHGDMIIMLSDGVLDGILFENKETYLADFLMSLKTNNAQEVANAIMEEVEGMQRGVLADDSTVLVAGVWER